MQAHTYHPLTTSTGSTRPPLPRAPPPSDEVQELQLSVDVDSLDQLLAFLSCSFMGGTDVDAPLKLSLERLAKAEWAQADILMVTDGEIPNPDDKIIQVGARVEGDGAVLARQSGRGSASTPPCGVRSSWRPL